MDVGNDVNLELQLLMNDEQADLMIDDNFGDANILIEQAASSPLVCGSGSSNGLSVELGAATPTSPSSLIYASIPDSTSCYTPAGTEEWVRNVDPNLVPTIGRTFDNLKDAIRFYEIYGLNCGFDTRLYTTKRDKYGNIMSKVVVCNRQGFKEVKPTLSLALTKKVEEKPISTDLKPKDSIKKRSKIRRFGCRAMIKFKLTNGLYSVESFYPGHSHKLCHVNHREFQKLARNLTLYHKQTIIDHSKLNIGSTKCFRIVKEQCKGYENVGASLMEFRNYGRRIKCFIGDKDAQMFVDNLEKLSTTNKGFYHAHEVDNENCLHRIFWADSESRKNYALFGDTISYDPTYSTNKYFMVFTPFTGVDHHKKSITFAAALLSHEDEASFIWVFRKFLDAMGQKEPQCILTDQCPAMKKVVPKAFTTAKHRFCMWHIMDKVTEKAGNTMCKDTDFLERINSIVWDMNLDTTEFEEKWLAVMEEFELQENPWFSFMFSIKPKWIPAYFKDWPMSCILRTTQRSESENSFFKQFENNRGTLVEFWMRFQSAMEQQRHNQKTLISTSHISLPHPVTPLEFELQASRVYTHEVFYDFQEELKASMSSCGVSSLSRTNNTVVANVDDGENNRTFEVIFDKITKEAHCSCKSFETKGLLCRHILLVYSSQRVKIIPERYIHSRWSKDAHKRVVCDAAGNVFNETVALDDRKREITKVWSDFYAIIAQLGDRDVKDIIAFRGLLKKFTYGLCEGVEPIPLSKEKELESLLGCSSSVEVTILPPKVCSNKGSRKRLKSKKTQAIEASNKEPRFCANCKRRGFHDKRTCPHPTATEPPPPEQENTTSKKRRLCANCKQMEFHDKRTCPNPTREDGSEVSNADMESDDEAENTEEIPTTQRMQTRSAAAKMNS